MAHDDEIWARARALREEGMPFKQIAASLGPSVGTIHLWTADIELPEEFHEQNRREATLARAESWRETSRAKRRVWQDEGRARARQHDPLHEAGCMLFWAEGSKHRNQLRLTNSDPHMIRFFRRFLVEAMAIAPSAMRVSLNVYTNNGLTVGQIEEHWMEVLDLPRSAFGSHTLDHYPTSSSGKKRNRLPYGVCTLRVNSTRVVQHIYGAIQEYAGFEEPAWLDGPKRN